MLKFYTSSMFRQMTQNISLRLGVTQITDEFLALAWLTCQFEQSWRLDDTEKYAWCSVL